MATLLRDRSITEVGDSEADRQTDLGPRRLLALVSEADADDVFLPRRIRDLADQRDCPLVLLGLYGEEPAQARIRRQLVSLAAAVRDQHRSVEILTRPGHDWVREVKSLWRPGDLVVFSARPSEGRGVSPASQILGSSLTIPVHVFSGLSSTHDTTLRSGRRLLVWGGNLATLAGFFWFQSLLDQVTASPLRAILLATSVVVEAGVLWLWNSATG